MADWSDDFENLGEAEVRKRHARGIYGEPGSPHSDYTVRWLEAKVQAREQALAELQASAARDQAAAARDQAIAAKIQASESQRANAYARQANWIAILAIGVAVLSLIFSIAKPLDSITQTSVREPTLADQN